MPAGETERSPSGLTVDTLNMLLTEKLEGVYRELVGLRAWVSEMDHRYQQRWESSEKAIAEKNETTEKRLEGMNEFRDQLSDVLRLTMPRVEAEQRAEQNRSLILELQSRHVTDIGSINSRLDLIAGGSQGADRQRTILTGIIVVAVSVIGLVVALVVR